MEFIIQLIAGAAGGNLAGAALKGKSLGVIGNSIVGLLGGGVCGILMNTLLHGNTNDFAAAVSGLDITTVLQSVVAGGVGGGVLTALAGALKSAFAKP